MGSLFNEEKVQVFRCPNCHEYSSADVEQCRFCSATVSVEMKRSIMEQEQRETKKANRNKALGHMGIGGLVFLAGVAVTFGSLYVATHSPRGGNYRIMFGLIIVGALDFLYGLFLLRD